MSPRVLDAHMRVILNGVSPFDPRDHTIEYLKNKIGLSIGKEGKPPGKARNILERIGFKEFCKGGQ